MSRKKPLGKRVNHSEIQGGFGTQVCNSLKEDLAPEFWEKVKFIVERS